MTTTTLDQFMAPARPVDRAPRRGSSVRLTRRGRVVVFLVALGLLLAAGFLGAGLSGAAQEKGNAVPTHTVVVEPGDTLWDLASDAADGGSVRDMEQQIKDLNGLDSGMLAAGQSLRIPN
ncbi:LysM peptidoglycan-binding domain-containing protein [Nocardioides sp. KR10-350]|uniref:LysM peptidoglycan-binding domain-containing protein n=1 Tax=Nocardioides cheoyonin TaxID=3156615 RepID=UPI0032B451A4